MGTLKSRRANCRWERCLFFGFIFYIISLPAPLIFAATEESPTDEEITLILSSPILPAPIFKREIRQLPFLSDERGPICGNGILESPERCDDRNTIPGDGCSPTCEEESSFETSLIGVTGIDDLIGGGGTPIGGGDGDCDVVISGGGTVSIGSISVITAETVCSTPSSEKESEDSYNSFGSRTGSGFGGSDDSGSYNSFGSSVGSGFGGSDGNDSYSSSGSNVSSGFGDSGTNSGSSNDDDGDGGGNRGKSGNKDDNKKGGRYKSSSDKDRGSDKDDSQNDDNDDDDSVDWSVDGDAVNVVSSEAKRITVLCTKAGTVSIRGRGRGHAIGKSGSVSVTCVSAGCGNGVVDLGEECDDGNTDPGDGCDSECQTEVNNCGNGQIDEDEECDDGNTDSGDGCDSQCKDEIVICPDDDLCLPSPACKGTSTGKCGKDKICCHVTPECVKNEDCDDGKICTDDACINGQCKHQNNTISCDDGKVCTTEDACKDGLCSGKQKKCPGGRVCSESEGGKCKCPEDKPYFCERTGKCEKSEAECNAGCKTNSDCDDGNLCTDDICGKKGQCSHRNNKAPCDDGRVCTENDRCGGGKCQSGRPKKCTGGRECSEDDGGQCKCPNEQYFCEAAGRCVADKSFCCGQNSDCDDGNLCTDDICGKKGQCRHRNNKAPCDDGDACTENDKCSEGQCTAGDPIKCDDGNLCTDDSCQDGKCVSKNNKADCDDGDACTENDKCSGGQCTAGDPIKCDEGQVCSEGECGDCGSDSDCDDDNLCTDDICKKDRCRYKNNRDECDDGKACTERDRCKKGECQGKDKKCEEGESCTEPDGQCVGSCSEDSDCDDGDKCTTDSCQDGSCVSDAVTCEGGKVCSDDECECPQEKPYFCEEKGECVENQDKCDEGEEESVCGNDDVEDGEECDDGNTASGDGCSAQCTVENECDHYECRGLNFDELYCCPPPGEGQCTLVSEGESCLDNMLCGNGTLDEGEECDDGNTEDGDKCDSQCQDECEKCYSDPCLNWKGPIACTAAVKKVDCDDPTCNSPKQCCGRGGEGEGEGEGGECPDKYSCTKKPLNGKGKCLELVIDCAPGYKPACQGSCGGECGGECCACIKKSEVKGTCTQEEIDKGCEEKCTSGMKATDGSDTTVCVCECPEAECGNKILEEGEECDEGDTINGDGCSSKCEEEDEDENDCSVCSTKKCKPEEACYAIYRKNQKPYAACYPADKNIGNDGVKCDEGGGDEKCEWKCNEASGQPPSNCEQGNKCQGAKPVCFEGATCCCSGGGGGGGGDDDGKDACTKEELDEGCEEKCTSSTTADGTVTTKCVCKCPEAECGNKILEEGEECDDGNKKDKDGCSSKCKKENLCGNGKQDPGEECDGEDTCTKDCACDWPNIPIKEEEVEPKSLKSGKGCSYACKVLRRTRKCGKEVKFVDEVLTGAPISGSVSGEYKSEKPVGTTHIPCNCQSERPYGANADDPGEDAICGDNGVPATCVG